MDYRRSKLPSLALLQRFVRNFSGRLREDLDTLRRVLFMVLAALKTARKQQDWSALLQLQATLVDSGVTQLLVQVLDAKITRQISSTSWQLLHELLQGEDDSGKKVNKIAQKGLCESITG